MNFVYLGVEAWLEAYLVPVGLIGMGAVLRSLGTQAQYGCCVDGGFVLSYRLKCLQTKQDGHH